MSAGSLLRYGGSVLALAAMVFLLRSIHGQFGQLDRDLLGAGVVAVLVLCSLVYASALLCVGAAWHVLVASVAPGTMSPELALRIFARTQIYKYIPTNVVHFVGRFVMAAQRGVSRTALAYAQAMEIVLMVAVSAAIALAFGHGLVLAEAGKAGLDRTLAAAIFLATGTIVALGAPVLMRDRLKSVPHRVVASSAALAGLLHAVFFLVNGAVLLVLVRTLAPQAGDWQSVMGIAAAGLLLGFVVPGAPGGLGVREAVFLAGLASIGLTPSLSLVIAFAHRLVALLADALLYAAEWAGRKRAGDPA